MKPDAAFGRITTVVILVFAALPTLSFAQERGQDAPRDAIQQKVTIILEDVDVRAALKQLFAAAHVNYVLDQSIRGTTTVSLTDVAFPIALESILKSSSPVSPTYRIEDGIYIVAPKDETKAPEFGGTATIVPPEKRSRIVKIHLQYVDAVSIALQLGGTAIISRASVLGAVGLGYGNGFGMGGFGGAYPVSYGIYR